MLQFPNLPDIRKYQSMLIEILALAKSLQYLPTDPQKKDFVFHQQLLKSSLFSARIEGNTLTFQNALDIDFHNPLHRQQREIANVRRAIQFLPNLPELISAKNLLNLHLLVMSGLSPDAGKFRSESSAIFDGLGNMVYLTPSVDDMKEMLDVLVVQINSQNQLSVDEQLILLPMCHYYIEKIHPFIDGNGRTGRVILQYQLRKINIFEKYVLPIDQYFDEHRSEYYFHLEKNTRKLESFITFFLKGLVWSVNQVIDSLQSNPKMQSQNFASLLPRREEIFHIIEDHPYISLDSIARRFPTIPRRTIAYDVQTLVKKGLVNKHGETRGVCYRARGDVK